MRERLLVGMLSAATALAACGGNVVVDHKGGPGGAGGTGAVGGAGGAPTTIPVDPECAP